MGCIRLFLAAGILAVLSIGSVSAQVRHDDRVYGIAIGDVARVNGLRINFRDRNLEEVNGVNLTFWRPYSESRGVVSGMALGVPLTGAEEIYGAGIGLAGIEAREMFRGIGIGGLGVGSGESLQGFFIGGLGVGAGENIRGIGIGGLGVGAGEDFEGFGFGLLGAGAGQDLTGIMFGGLGAGAGENARGILIGGLGAGAGVDMTGIAIGGIGVGAGGNVTGILIGGVGVGAGGDITGIAIGGLGVGAGGTLRGFGFGGLGVGAPRIEGVVLSVVGAGGEEVVGLSVAPAYFKIATDGYLQGISISAFNDIRRGEQRGLAVGILNMARDLHGLQIGLINIVRNNTPGRRVLPILNFNFD